MRRNEHDLFEPKLVAIEAKLDAVIAAMAREDAGAVGLTERSALSGQPSATRADVAATPLESLRGAERPFRGRLTAEG